MNHSLRATAPVRLVTATIAALIGIGFATLTAGAQSPTPAQTMQDFAPGPVNAALAAIIEGLGMGACAYSLSSLETTTVNYINSGNAVISEISPQSGCGSLSN